MSDIIILGQQRSGTSRDLMARSMAALKIADQIHISEYNTWLKVNAARCKQQKTGNGDAVNMIPQEDLITYRKVQDIMRHYGDVNHDSLLKALKRNA